MENTLAKEDFVKILSKYNIGAYVSHKFLKVESGTVRSCNYFLTATKGNFVLKIENIKSKALKIANNVINALFNRGVLVQRIYETKAGRNYLLYKKKYITIKDYLIGKNPEFFSDNLIRQVAKNLAMMQKVFLELNIYIPKRLFADELFHNYDFKKKVKNKTYLKFYDKWLKYYESLNHKLLRKCLSHGDLIEINMIVNNDRLIGFIDFEEMGKDYLISDVCSFMSMALMEQNSKTFRQSFKTFLREYQKYITLNNEEKKALYYFIGLDLLRCEDLRHFSKEINKISLEEFMAYY